MKEKDGQNIKIPISIAAREGGGNAYSSPSSRATFLLASHIPRERASEPPIMCRLRVTFRVLPQRKACS